MSDRINCRNCIHFNDLEHRCCLNDGKVIKRECYFILSNRKPKGKDVVIENLKTKIADLEEQLKNAIVPKFKLDQNVYRVYQDNIESGMICAYVIDDCGITYHLTFNKSKYCETYCYVNENDLFTTKEEAQAKLEELKGE